MSPQPASRPAVTSFITRAALHQAGLTRDGIDRALAAGTLIRLRRGRYVTADVHEEVIRAGTLGGRLDCLSLLRHLGVFVLATPPLHLQVDVGASRLPERPDGVVCHWRASEAPPDALLANRVEALAQAVKCQDPRAAIATLDSALHLGFIDEADLARVFARLPRRHQALRPLLDARSEAGSESLMRLVLRTLGCHLEVQVVIHGVGRVDFVVDGWLIIECDSTEFHSSWEARKKDRRRDLAAAALGYSTVRILAEDIFFHRDEVRTALQAVLDHGPRVSRRGRGRSPRPQQLLRS
jgi:very-short-patch-repair endonuclease